MSTIRKKPFIETVITNMTTALIGNLRTAINNGGTNTEAGFGNLPNANTVTPVYFKLEENNYKTGILIYNTYDSTKTQCVLIAYHRFQDLQLYNLNVSNSTYEKVNEYCDINELRRVIDDILEEKQGGEETPAGLLGILEGSDYITVDMNEAGTKVQVKPDAEYTPFMVELTGSSGTLTDDEFAELTTSKEAVIICDEEYYYLSDEQETFLVFTHTGRDNSQQTNIKNIYVYTSAEAQLTYKTWTKTSLNVGEGDFLILDFENHELDAGGYTYTGLFDTLENNSKPIIVKNVKISRNSFLNEVVNRIITSETTQESTYVLECSDFILNCPYNKNSQTDGKTTGRRAYESYEITALFRDADHNDKIRVHFISDNYYASTINQSTINPSNLLNAIGYVGDCFADGTHNSKKIVALYNAKGEISEFSLQYEDGTFVEDIDASPNSLKLLSKRRVR